MWMGGTPPLGYDVRERKLVVNETEAELVRLIFRRFLRVGSATKLPQELRRAGHTTKSGRRGTVTGARASRSTSARSTRSSTTASISARRCTRGRYPGEHEAIIDRATWDKVHAILAGNTVSRSQNRAQTPALLRGIIFAHGGHAMTPSHTRKAGKLYRYYVATDAIRQGYSECRVRSVPAAEIEGAVIAQVRHMLSTPEIIARTWAAAEESARLFPSARSSRSSPTSHRYGTSCSQPNRCASSGCWLSGSICHLMASRCDYASRGCRRWLRNFGRGRRKPHERADDRPIRIPRENDRAEAEDIIERLSLSPHPEGGFYRETDQRQPPCPVPSAKLAAVSSRRAGVARP